VLLCLQRKIEPSSETSVLCYKVKTMDKVKKKTLSVNFGLSYLCTSDDAGLALALHSPVQSDPVWHGPVQHFAHEFKTTLHI